MLNVKTIFTSFILMISCSFAFGQATSERERFDPKEIIDNAQWSANHYTQKNKQLPPVVYTNGATARKLIQISQNEFIEIVTIEGKDFILGIRRQEN